MARPVDPFIGRDLLNGQFQILQKIGSGGMGSVYKALQPEMNRMVAVKILHPKLAGRSDLVSRFRREARAMSHLTHPNTVKVFLYGELDDGSLYIVMEYLDGKNLNQTVRGEGPMPVERALPLLIQSAGALDEAHGKGIVHRDMKPENIFVTRVPLGSNSIAPVWTSADGKAEIAKVLDFGLAKVTEREMRPGSLILTQEGMVFGTPEFMSPEQAQGKALDPKSDVYSLAVILYEVLTGKLPFEAKNAMEYIQLHVQSPPIPLATRVPERTFPPLLWPVIARALNKEPKDRFGSSAEFGAALTAVLEGKTQLPAPRAATPVAAPHKQVVISAPGARASMAHRDTAAHGSSAPVSAASLAGPRPVTNMKLLVAIAAAFLLVGVGLALAYLQLR
jgi:serine/threonine protein kinase